MANARAQLLSLLAEKSFRLGEFKLSSGGTSDYYIDCRLTTLDANGALLTGQAVLEEIQRQGWWQADAIGGLTMGADPIVVATSVISAQQGKPISGFLVRKAEKTHGMGQRIEGFRHKPARVVIVDDVCTTGASTVQAIEAAREFGFEIAGVLCLVEREEAGGRVNVEKAAEPAPFVALFTANDVRAEHVKALTNRALLLELKENARPLAEMSVSSYSGRSGIYGFFLLKGRLCIGQEELAAGNDDALLYLGKTESSQKARDAGQHLADGKTGSSTLRRSVAALLREELNLKPQPRSKTETSERRFTNFKLDAAGEKELTEWMVEHLSLGFLECKLPKTKLRDLEQELISIARPALNLQHNRKSVHYDALDFARRCCANLARIGERAPIQRKLPGQDS